MVVSINALFLNEVVDCIAQARAPTDLERAHVAQRIWSDGGARQSGRHGMPSRHPHERAWTRCELRTWRYPACLTLTWVCRPSGRTDGSGRVHKGPASVNEIVRVVR